MKKLLLLSILTIIVLFPNISFGQTVNLGILESFEGYTGAGAITNGAGATWTGDAGTNVGIISGLGEPPSFVGNIYNANTVTAQCRFDLFRLYIHLNDLFVNFPATHAAAFGGGETLTPGVYSIPGAGSIGAALTLDGGGNPNAFFVIKFYGAMTVGAGATVNLINGTKSSNVFFIADGAISVAATTNLKGTLFSKLGAVGLGADAILQGRMLTLEGAIVTGVGATVSRPPDACTIPIFCENNCSPAPAVDVLGVLSNYALYTNLGAVPNTGTSGIDGNIGTNSGAISGFESSVVIGSYHTANASTAQANIDLDNAYNSLMALPNTVPSAAGVSPVVLAHAAVFGSVAAGGETINAGVYFIDGAGSLGGLLILDGQNNTNAIFVFKFAGAFSVAAQAKIILINGARRCNVFWIGGAGVPTGAISIGAGADLKGTFLSHGGACGSGASVFLGGRQLSTDGAVNTYSGIIYNNPVCITSTSLTTLVIRAVNDNATINGFAGGTFTNVMSNDSLNRVVVVASQVTTTFVSSTNAGITLSGTNVIVAAGTPVGTYSLIYTICEVAKPTNCSNATVTVTVVANDFTPSIDINSVTFLTAGSAQDFVANVSEISGNSSVSQVIIKIPKQSAFTISYSASTTTSNVLGGVTVNNNDWLITENTLFITMTLKPGVVIGASAFSRIGFTITLKSNIPSQTWQPITATIVKGSSGDSVNGNNAFNTVLKAQ